MLGGILMKILGAFFKEIAGIISKEILGEIFHQDYCLARLAKSSTRRTQSDQLVEESRAPSVRTLLEYMATMVSVCVRDVQT